MRLEQISFGRRPVSLLIEKLSQLLKARRQRKVGAAEGTLGDFKSGFSNTNGLRQLICGSQGIQFVVEDSPELFFTFHQSSPTLADFSNQSGGEVLSSKGQSLPLVTSHVATHKKAG